MRLLVAFIIILIIAIAVITGIGVSGGFEPGSDPTPIPTPTPTPTALPTPTPTPTALPSPTPTPLPTPTPAPEGTPTPLPTVSLDCSHTKDAVQEALDTYHAEHGAWPTADGTPGDIDWGKLVPDHIDGVPSNDGKCDWQVNSNPEGEVCVLHHC